MKRKDTLRRWELAMALAVCITLGQGLMNWWGVIFPGLSASLKPETVEITSVESDGVILRSQIWEWIQEWIPLNNKE